MAPDLQLAVVTDYRGAFWSSTTNVATMTTMDVKKLVLALAQRGVEAWVVPASEALDRIKPGVPFVYTSTEHPNGRYKRYLEAVVMGLEMRGSQAIPRSPLLIAHHDKVAMEVLRFSLLGDLPGQPKASWFGTLEEFNPSQAPYPLVLKPSFGAGAAGVELVQEAGEAFKIARRLSNSAGVWNRSKARIKRLARPEYSAPSRHQNSFVAQEFLAGYSGDFKVLRYGSRFFIVGRTNRPNDFRASGGGRLDYKPWLRLDVEPILEAAWTWAERLESPFASLDIAFDPQLNNGEPALIEFQCVSFGPAAIEGSVGHFQRAGNAWTRVEVPAVLEEAFADACVEALTGEVSWGI